MPTSRTARRAAVAAVAAAALGAATLCGHWLAEDARKKAVPLALKPIPRGEVRIAPGSFTMGSPESEVAREEWNSDEPQHPVTLNRAFVMQRTEVTQRQWREVLSEAQPGFVAPHRFSGCGPDCPAETVSWFEAVAFANLLSARDDAPRCYKTSEGEEYTWEDAEAAQPAHLPEGLNCLGWRLPTEAEWEFAARGRGPSRQRATHVGPNDADTLSDIAWYIDNSEAPGHGIDCSDWDWKDNGDITLCGPQPVGQKMPNDLGLYDMLGNVWEWTWDWYGPYPDHPTTDPIGPREGGEKVLRGCSWYIHPSGCRAAERSRHTPETRNGNLGFRLVRTVD